MSDVAGAVAEIAPAKINLALHVTGRRADGYHLIETLAVFTAFGDSVTVAPSADDAVTVSGPFGAALPVGEGNLVVQARDAMRAELVEMQFSGRRSEGGTVGHDTRNNTQPPTRALRIHLEKNLPIASGIGGGSSDAAATLRAMNRYWKAGLSDTDLAAIGLRLGADVPMCLANRPLIAGGIGEAVRPVPDFPALPIVLVNPGVGVATPRIFQALRSRENPPLPNLPGMPDFATLIGWLAHTRNDLMPPALSLEPLIVEVLEAIAAQGSPFVRMSGSGATCFGLFGDMASARRAAKVIAQARRGWFVVATETTKA